MNKEEKENKQLKEQLQQRINKALNKIDNMFDIADVNKFLEDLLEIEWILKGE